MDQFLCQRHLLISMLQQQKGKELSQKLVRIHTHYVYLQLHSSWVTGFDLGGSLGDQILMYDCLQGSIQAFLLCIPKLDGVVGKKLKGDQHDCKVYSKTTHNILQFIL
jgi:hypothetical protein